MNGEHLSDIESVDISFGSVIAKAYEGLAQSGTQAYCRFLERESKNKIFRLENSDPRTILSKIASKAIPALNDLPLIVYYREQGVVGDTNQQPIALKYICIADNKEIEKDLKYLRLSAIPITLTYSLLFVAWDRATLDKISLAWFCHIAPLGRRTTRFMTAYKIEEDRLEVPSSIATPREILASAESFQSEEPRLWAARCSVEVNTQVLYGQSFIMPHEKYKGSFRKVEF